jgi:phage baseplate assembly protein W
MDLISISIGTPINLYPSGVVEEVIQNVRIIMSQTIYGVPYDRALGINGDVLDNPIQINKSMVQVALYNAIKADEPRAEIHEISFTGDALDGKLNPIVRIFINE